MTGRGSRWKKTGKKNELSNVKAGSETESDHFRGSSGGGAQKMSNQPFGQLEIFGGRPNFKGATTTMGKKQLLRRDGTIGHLVGREEDAGEGLHSKGGANRTRWVTRGTL